MNKVVDLVIIGAGLSGLSCALVTGRGLLKVAILNDEQKLHGDFDTHNFITNDGQTKQSIFEKGLNDLKKYPNIEYHNNPVEDIALTLDGYLVTTQSGLKFEAKKIVFAMGNLFDFSDLAIDGLRESWGVSVFSCPYCHGYELKGKKISIIAQNESDVNFIKLVSRWSSDITIFIQSENYPQIEKAIRHNIENPVIYKDKILRLEHNTGNISEIVMVGGVKVKSDAVFISDINTKSNNLINKVYSSTVFNPQLNKEIYKTDSFGRTDLRNVFIIGDSRTRFSTLVGAANEGFLTGVMIVNDYVY